MQPVRSKMIQTHIAGLRGSFQHVVAQHDLTRLRQFYDEKNYAEMVKYVRDSMNLKLRVKVGLVNKGGPKSKRKDTDEKHVGIANVPAWIETPDPMPLINSREFEQTLVTVYLRKSFLEENKFEKVAMAIAHEMSHAVLNGLRHPLRGEEEAVDLTAMLLGYRDVYVAGAEYAEIGPSGFWRKFRIEVGRRFTGNTIRQYHWLSYLTPEEICYAATQMGRRWTHNPSARPRGISSIAILLAGLVERLAGVALVLVLVFIVALIASIFG